MENNALTEVIITTEKVRRIVGAEAAVNAAAIDVETAWYILRETVFNIGHG
jgi:hypothetical protein